MSFIRFNLNIDVVFDFESKYINEFSKRHQIELSHTPRDRTSLFDTVGLLLNKFSKTKRVRMRRFMVIITDGDDSSSYKSLIKLAKKIVRSGVTIICVGLNTNDRQKKALERLARMSANGVFIEATDNLDALF